LKGERNHEERLSVLRHRAGEIPSNKVYEDELCYAFHDIAPQAPTHFLVIPKAHIASVSGINAENSAVVAHIFEVIAKVTKEMGIESGQTRTKLSLVHVQRGAQLI